MTKTIDNQAVKISYEKPPVWPTLVKHFNPDWRRTAVAFADTIHAKKHPLPRDVQVHEKVHLRQQGYSTEKAFIWWAEYIKNPQFRYEQELEAYREQYKYLETITRDKNQLYKSLLKLANDLSTMYGVSLSLREALDEIKNDNK